MVMRTVVGMVGMVTGDGDGTGVDGKVDERMATSMFAGVDWNIRY